MFRLALAISACFFTAGVHRPSVAHEPWNTVDPQVHVAGFAMWNVPSQPPHRVLAQPQWLTPEQAKKRRLQELVHPPVATIQAAVVDPQWRQPYAYGYFGSTPHRHWQRHFGYQNAYTQWKLR